MGLPVVTVAAGGLPVVESAIGGTPVTEAANKFGMPVTKVVGGPGMPVVFVSETGGVVGGGGGSDPSFANVVFLWEAEGTNGQTAGLVDVKGHAITTSGTGQITNTRARIGTTCYSVGTGGANMADSPDWDIGLTASAPWTIEFSAYEILLQNWLIMDHYTGAPKAWWIRNEGTGELRVIGSSDGSTNTMDVTTVGFGFVAGAWNDVCIEKDATGKFRFYRNGVMKYSNTPANGVFAAGAGLVSFGNDGNPNGYLDHMRITKGVARYASDSGYTFNATPWPTS
jgi:hypothetical protein